MAITTHHFVAIDAAMAKGLTLNFKGVPITFGPLNLDALASIVAAARGTALDIWRQHELRRGISPSEWRLHTMELNGILFGAMPQQVLDYMSNPLIRALVIKLSIAPSLPNLKDEEIENLVRGIIDVTEEEANQLIDTIAAMTVGPSKAASDQKGNDGMVDPTGSRSPSGESSLGPSANSDSAPPTPAS